MAWKLDSTRVSDDAERIELIGPGDETIHSDVVPTQVAHFLNRNLWPQLRHALHIMYSLDGGYDAIRSVRDLTLVGQGYSVEVGYTLFHLTICIWNEGFQSGVMCAELAHAQAAPTQLEDEPRWLQRLVIWIAWNL